MFKTKFIVIFLTLVCASVLKVNAQGVTLEQESDLQPINVVAFFCKNDTMTFKNHRFKKNILNNDTTTTGDFTHEFMIVVNDSTSKGYRMEYIPISYQCDVLDGTDSLMMEVLDMVKDVHCFFTTDELGKVQHIENWREIRDIMKKTTSVMVDRFFEKDSIMGEFVSRKQFKNALLMEYSTESQIRKVYDELELLFGLHGGSFDVGMKEHDDVENGYPQHIVAQVGFTEKEDENDIEGDYAIMTKAVTTIPVEDAFDVGLNSMLLLMEEKVADSLDSKKSELLDSIYSAFGTKEFTITQNEYFSYFFNGWPKLCYTERNVVGNRFKMIEQNVIEWTSRSWNSFENGEATKPEEMKGL